MSEVAKVNEVLIEESKFISHKRNDFLKLIAMITMFIDHLGHMGIVDMIIMKLNEGGAGITYDYYTLFRTIGRIAFPIFAYQIAIGYSKTSNLMKYVQRLFIFACIAQLPYMFFNKNFSVHPLHFNVIFMLLTGVIIIALYDTAKSYFKKSGFVNEIVSVALVVLMILIIIMPQYLEAYFDMNPLESPNEALFRIGTIDFNVELDFAFSYGTYGLLMILLFHIFKGKPLYMIGSYVVLEWLGFMLSYTGIVYGNSLQWFGEQYTYIRSFAFTSDTQFLLDYKGGYPKLMGLFFQMRSLLALPFIIVFERFFVKIKLNKFIGYWFYPLHIILILVIAIVLHITL